MRKTKHADFIHLKKKNCDVVIIFCYLSSKIAQNHSIKKYSDLAAV